MHDIASAPVSQGIERAPLNAHPTLKSGNSHSQHEEKVTALTRKSDTSHHVTQPSPTSGIRQISRSLKAKIHRRSHTHPDVSTDQRILDKTVLAPTLAPNPPVATKEDRFDGEPLAKPSLPPVKEILHRPIATLKTVAQVEGGGGVAATIATKDVNHEAGVQLVRANEDLADAKTEDEEAQALEKLALLKSVRQDSYVRWTLDRHIAKIGRLQPHPPTRKAKHDFVHQCENGKWETDWRSYGHHQFQFYLQEYGGHYIGASDELPEPTEAALISSFERILLTSTPVQDAFMTLKRIAQWEYPRESALYMVIYFVFLFYSYITRAFLLFALYTVIKRRYFPPTIPELREDLKAAEDKDTTAHDLSQLIDQHGAHGWVDPLIQKAGPTALLQMEDLANFMEVLRNFYEWRDPTRTAITLGWLVFLWIMITLTPVSILIKESFFAAGVMFFGLAPVAARYPQYRLLLNPVTWLFWRIPTHSEWAIARLKAEATRQLELMHEQTTSTKAHVASDVRAQQLPPTQEPPKDVTPIRIGRYHCRSGKRQGNLCVDTEKVSFETHLTASEQWSLSYRDMKSIEKAVGSSTTAGDDLIFTAMDRAEYRASGLSVRDEVFSQIIGYSHVEWQRMA